jgi:Fe-S-cluster containining protein
MKLIDNIPFECTKCGECCRWDGYVFLTDSDIDTISKHFKKSREDWIEDNTKKVNNKLVLKDKDGSKGCIYLKDNECTIFDIKPKQCSEYPKSYDKRCPGFKKNGSSIMKSKYIEAIEKINEKFSNLQQYEKTITDNLFNDLQNTYDASKVASMAVEEGIDYYFNPERIKISSLEDLFGFNRVDAGMLIHKSSKDLWKIEQDPKGDVRITRLFDNNGEPLKG